jgi:hypothetical protein
MKRPRHLYEVEPPPGYHWQGRNQAPGDPDRYRWQERFRCIATKARAFRVAGAGVGGTVVRQYRWFKRTDTYFLNREWIFRDRAGAGSEPPGKE